MTSLFHRRPHKFPAFRERVLGASNGEGRTCVPYDGALAQLGEHLLCKQGVVGSIPTSSTTKRSKACRGSVRNNPHIRVRTSQEEPMGL